MPASRRRLARLAQLAEEAVQLGGRDAGGVLGEELSRPGRAARPTPRPVLAETVTIGGRWRSRALDPRRARPRCHGSPMSHFERTTSVEQSAPCARCPRPRGPGRRGPRSRRRGRARRRRARPPRARAAPSSTRSPGAACACGAGPAVSTSTKVVSPRSSTVSIESRVVPGDLGDDHALLAEQRVQEARLADVRPAEDRDADRLLADLRAGPAPGAGRRRVEQVAGAVAVHGRERDRVAEAEPVELERERVPARVVDLVREQDHRLRALRAGSRRAPRRRA